MPRYRKKPFVIESEKFTQENGERLAAWCGGTFHHTAKPGYTSAIRIQTLESVMTAQAGDWIIKGAKGEFYPCKPDIFEATYDSALHLVMVCGIDCHPGDAVCNNYCNEAPQKGRMSDTPPPGPDAPKLQYSSPALPPI